MDGAFWLLHFSKYHLGKNLNSFPTEIWHDLLHRNCMQIDSWIKLCAEFCTYRSAE